MRKLKRALSFIIATAMILSLMPTFAMAAVGDTYMYVFNPKKLGNAEDYNTADLIFENTTTDSN